MPVCPNCSHDNREGIIFCEKCGFALGAVSISTAKLGEQDDNLAAGTSQMSEDHVILLHVKDQDEPLTLKVIGEVILGREGVSEDAVTFVSLEKYGAGNLGVSRSHAKLIRKEDQLLLRDLGSTNHTYLNGQRLTENRDYALRDGDEVSLGKLTFRLFFA